MVRGLEKFRSYLDGKKLFLYTDRQALEPLIKRNRCKKYSARLTRWLDRFAHFDIWTQHIAGSNLKFTDFLSRNLVERARTENIYDEQYVINFLTEQAQLNIKSGRIFMSQSQQTPNSKMTLEHKSNNQSETNRIFEKNRQVNKINEQAETSPNNNAIKFKRQEKLPLPNCQNLSLLSSEEMDRIYFHWGATTGIMRWKLSEDERKAWNQED